MNLYFHGSPISHLRVLEPRLSNHKESFVYLSSNYSVSLLYTVRCNWYTYGFVEQSNKLEYTEYYENQLFDLYESKSGSVYECVNAGIFENPTNIHCAYVFRTNVAVQNETFIENVYLEILKQEECGEIVIKRFSDLNVREIQSIQKQVRSEYIKEIEKNTNSEYLLFLESKFQSILS